jgi:hypothetical protein
MTLTPYQHLMKWRIYGKTWRISTFERMDPEYDKTVETLVGSGLVRPLYTIFDLDTDTVRCKLSDQANGLTISCQIV